MQNCKFDIYSGGLVTRFVLGKNGTNPLAIFGINPSRADKFNSDRTMDRIGNLVQAWGYSGFVMFNLYPKRDTHPKELPKEGNASLIKQNASVIFNQLRELKLDSVWAAWGDAFDKRSYFLGCLDAIFSKTQCLELKWKICGSLTKSQNPRHPLSGRPHIITENSQLTEFNMGDYMRRKNKGV